MFKKFSIPILAAIGVILAIIVTITGLRRPPVPPIDFEPPKSPYKHYVAGAGIIEASSLNIHVAAAIDGVVEELFVKAGDIVKKGAPLFRVDTRNLSALKEEAEANKAVAFATLNKLIAEPRPEEIPVLEARVKQAKMRLSDEYTQYTLFQNVSDKRAISFNDFNQRKYAARIARYELEQAKADLALLESGAWIEEIKIAQSQVAQANARIQVANVALERAIVRAPLDGMVMQVNFNVGDFARGSQEDNAFNDPLLVFGAVDPMHVRVDVDEDDAWRVYSGAPAVAYVRGNSQICFPLQFVSIEPYIVPKRSLTGENLERVDTRVLQVIYSFDKKDLPVYLGQLVDIFIEAKPSEGL